MEAQAQPTTAKQADLLAMKLEVYGAELGLRMPHCLVHYVAPEWVISCSCIGLRGDTLMYYIKLAADTKDLARAIENQGIRLMTFLQSKFHTKH